MRLQVLKKLRETYRHLQRGGFPDLGKPHPKAGYRYAVGHATYENGKTDFWRETSPEQGLVDKKDSSPEQATGNRVPTS